MKWSGFTKEGETTMKKLTKKLFGNKVAYYLMTVVAVGLLLGASVKWHP